MRKSLQQLALAAVLSALAIGATIGMTEWIKPEITSRSGRYQTPDFTNPAIPFQFGIAIFIVILCGCIARTLFGHLRFFRVLILFLALIPIVHLIDWMFSKVLYWIDRSVNAGVFIDVPGDIEIQRRVFALLPMMVVFVIGMTIGVHINTLIRRGEPKKIVRIRRRLRKRRSRFD